MFNFTSNASVEYLGEDRGIIRVQRIDTHQEMNIRMEISISDGIIHKIEGQTLRCPGGTCPKAVKELQTLVGKSLGHGISKALKEGVVSPQGCMHLGEMIMDAARSLVQAKFTLKAIELGYDEEAMQQSLVDELQGSCLQYSGAWTPHRLCEE